MIRDDMKAFLMERYKYERLYGRGDDYGDCVVDAALLDLQEHGEGLISKFESITGRQVKYTVSDVVQRQRKRRKSKC